MLQQSRFNKLSFFIVFLSDRKMCKFATLMMFLFEIPPPPHLVPYLFLSFTFSDLSKLLYGQLYLSYLQQLQAWKENVLF